MVPVFSTALSTTVMACKKANFVETHSPNKNPAHRMPYNPQPSTVAKAKQHRHAAIKMLTQLPQTASNADMVRLVPVSTP